MAEQLAGEKLIGQGAAVHGHEELLRAVTHVVDGAREEVLSGAGRALDEHRGQRARDTRGGCVGPLHCGIAAHHVIEAVPLAQRLPQVAGLARAATGLAERGLHGRQQLLGAEGLPEVVRRLHSQRLDGGVERRVRGDDDCGRAYAPRAQVLEQLNAIGVGEHPVEDQQRGLPLRGGRGKRRSAIGDALHKVAARAEHPLDAAAHLRVVVNDEYGAAFCHDAANSLRGWSLYCVHPDDGSRRRRVVAVVVEGPPRAPLSCSGAKG